MSGEVAKPAALPDRNCSRCGVYTPFDPVPLCDICGNDLRLTAMRAALVRAIQDASMPTTAARRYETLALMRRALSAAEGGAK